MGIRDSIKYCYFDTKIEYMSFLEEYWKSEDERKSSKPTSTENEKSKVRATTATWTSRFYKTTKETAGLIESLVGQMKSLL